VNATRYLPFVGRLLIGLPFAMSGFSKLAAYGPTVAKISAVGLPVAPLAFAVAVAVELGGGLLLIAGFRARLIAIALALFSLVTAAWFHSKPQERHAGGWPASDRGLRRGSDQR
jgi:putative oxidoreductase